MQNLIVAAGNAEDAISLCQAHPTTIDLLVTDIVMPEMNGLALATRLCADFPAMAKLFMSGYTADSITSHGADSDDTLHNDLATPTILQKPFTIDELLVAVQSALEN